MKSGFDMPAEKVREILRDTERNYFIEIPIDDADKFEAA